MIFSVSAEYGTHLNVTMFETVFQNVSFARDFDLEEVQDFCRMDGILNITNPNDETVFDIYISFSNINRMTTDFIWDEGRNGTMWFGGAPIVRELGAVANTVNDISLWSDLGMDLDNDLDYDDYVYVNSTHIIFNLSSEANPISIRLHNSTHNVSIQTAGITSIPLDMDDNITGSRLYGNISVNGITATNNQIDAGVTFTLNELMVSPIVIHIPELRSNNYTTFIYNVTCLDTEPPIDIETSYVNPRTGFNRKVLAGYNWTITQKVNNSNYLGATITNLNISIRADNVSWNGTIFNFSLLELQNSGDFTNVGGSGSSTINWWWAPDGGTLSAGQVENITYIMGAPHAVPFTATYRALIETIQYRSSFLMSNLSIMHINASAEVNFSFEKRIERPADNVLSHNVTWEISPVVTTPLNISYDITKVTLWVTEDYDPMNTTEDTEFGFLEKNYSGVYYINLTSGWNAAADKWYFNYTDGFNASLPPPIVWMKPDWIISNRFGQIVNSSTVVNGNDIYMKYIYVVHGYWLEVSKNVTSIGEDQYSIYTYVENIGNGWTPQNELVTVYDFIPNDFEPYSWSVNPNQNQSVGIPGGEFYGTSYVWQIPWKGVMDSSLGPKNGPYATTPANYSWNVSYIVNGSGPYRVTDLYIVGLDPLRVDGASASPVIAVISGLQSYTREVLYAGIVAFLIIINVTNLIITNRINRRLESPPPENHNHNRKINK